MSSHNDSLVASGSSPTENGPDFRCENRGSLFLLFPLSQSAQSWVEEHLPDAASRNLVHADFRTGNLIVGPDGLRCVLDWEIARIGDPMQDLGVLPGGNSSRALDIDQELS